MPIANGSLQPRYLFSPNDFTYFCMHCIKQHTSRDDFTRCITFILYILNIWYFPSGFVLLHLKFQIKLANSNYSCDKDLESIKFAYENYACTKWNYINGKQFHVLEMAASIAKRKTKMNAEHLYHTIERTRNCFRW